MNPFIMLGREFERYENEKAIGYFQKEAYTEVLNPRTLRGE
jgi:hypothetical protein